ncbi:YHS domain-containing (seleno)protein [Pontimicrobium sp. IMCC45349]|uniref:YHS domain-containing (seleno)protein n=1 Tax=Pontimicrobium sp. IMCC45349 TaxID=3391574 RepID=UPI0039A2A978
MRGLILLFFVGLFSLQAQNIDYNTKKGFAAQGYDVVAYFNNQAIEGDKKFTTEYDTIKYKFSTQENLNAFLKTPEKYIPQYGGYCAYAVALKAKKVSIDPKTFEIRNGKLYLFYNAWGTNTLKLWLNENPTHLVEKGDNNWDNIKY